MKSLYFFLLFFIVVACRDNPNGAKKQYLHVDSRKASESNDPGFAGTDSIEVYFYADPANQKEFTRLFITDQPSVKVLIENIANQAASMKECSHDGKMFFYRNGEVFKTAYISTADSCRYFAYAINATPQFVPISDQAYSLIRSFKLQSNSSLAK